MSTPTQEASAELMLPEPGSGAMFDRIAARYDLMNRLLSLGLDRRWRRRAVAALRLEPGDRVLDLATGTGDVALEVLRQQPTASVVGVDPARRMLAAARRKAVAAGRQDGVRFEVGRAEELPFADAAFDRLTIAFGIRNVGDRPAAFREMARVTRPGGRISILELTEPRRGPLARLARFHIHRVVPRLGAWLAGAREYRYLEESIAAFPPPREVVGTMEACGLTAGVVHLFLAAVPEAGR